MSRLEKITKKNNLVHDNTVQEKEPRNYNWVRILLIFFIMGFLVYFLVFSPIFKVKTIKVEGYSHPEAITAITSEQLGGQLAKNNIFFFNVLRAKQTLYGDQLINKAEIKKIYPNTIFVRVEESHPQIIWVTAGDKFLIDERGVVIGNAGEESLVQVNDAANINVERGKVVASPTFIKFINSINDNFSGATGTKINKISVFDLITDIHIVTSDGWTVYLDASKDPDAQLKNLSRVLEVARKEGAKFQYIDLRLDNKAFYK